MGPEQDTFHRGDLCLKAGRHCDVDVASVDRKQVICLAKWRVSDLGRRVRWEIQISSGIRIAQEMWETMRGPGNCGEHVMRRSHLSLKSISTKILLQLSPFFSELVSFSAVARKGMWVIQQWYGDTRTLAHFLAIHHGVIGCLPWLRPFSSRAIWKNTAWLEALLANGRIRSRIPGRTRESHPPFIWNAPKMILKSLSVNPQERPWFLGRVAN